MAKKLTWTDIKRKYSIYSNKTYNNMKKDFETPEKFEAFVANNPYNVIINYLGKTFLKADALIQTYFPEFATSRERCHWCCWYLLKQNESDGDTCINANIIARMLKEDFGEVANYVVDCIKNDPEFCYNSKTKKVALKETYDAEQLIANEILSRVKYPKKHNIAWGKYTVVDGLDLTDEQMQILKMACEQSIMMLNGSAGTGKSSAMKALIEMINDNGMWCDIVAPTGIAAKRIAEVSNHPASTIHKYLARLQNGNYFSSPDFLIIDEMSMVGVHLLARLLRVISEKTKIVFICDEAQLASISCGNIVQDVIDSGLVPTVKLTKVFRYGKGGIATVATDIRMGKSLDANVDFNDYSFIPISKHPLEDVIKVYDVLRQEYKEDEIMILSPWNVRNAGTYRINNAIQKTYNPNEPIFSMKKGDDEINFCINDRVVNTENNYHLQGEFGEIAIMNGDIGVIKEVVAYPELGEVFAVQFDNGLAYLEKNDMFKQLLGYSITIHKSQGSQAKAVIVVADKSHSFSLSRNLMYVACSRAQKKLIVIGDIDAINQSLSKEENKEVNS